MRGLVAALTVLCALFCAGLAGAPADRAWQTGKWTDVTIKRQMFDFGPGSSPFGQPRGGAPSRWDRRGSCRTNQNSEPSRLRQRGSAGHNPAMTTRREFVRATTLGVAGAAALGALAGEPAEAAAAQAAPVATGQIPLDLAEWS